MPLYAYEAKNTRGLILKGEIEAVDEMYVISYLRAREYYPIKVVCLTKNLNIKLFAKQVSKKEISLFCKQLSSMLSAGINISSALKIAYEQSESKKIRKIFKDIFNKVQRGNELSSAMKSCEAFPGFLISMIAVGESTGKIEVVLKSLSFYFEKEYRFSQKVKQSLIYPLIVIVFTLLVVVFLVLRILPIFIEIHSQFNQTKLPFVTQLLIELSDSLKGKRSIFSLITFIFICIMIKSCKYSFLLEFIDKVKINTPILGKTYKKNYSIKAI